MAYATINVTINGVSTPAIDVSGDGVEVILEQSLTNYDKGIMDAVAAEAGATFADKLAAYTHPNGQNGAVLYAKLIVTTAAYNIARTKASATVGAAAVKNAEQDVVLDDHEARIVVLEP